MVKIITKTRRTTYSHEHYLTKHLGSYIQIVRVSDKAVVDEVFVFRIRVKGEDIEIYGE